MLYVSIFVELLRSRPSLAIWLAALVQALLWTLVPSLFYASPPGDGLHRFLEALRAAAPHFAGGSPPLALEIPRAEAADYLRTAFRVWTTELRPKLRSRLPGCECGSPGGCPGTCGCGP